MEKVEVLFCRYSKAPTSHDRLGKDKDLGAVSM